MAKIVTKNGKALGELAHEYPKYFLYRHRTHLTPTGWTVTRILKRAGVEAR